MRVVLAHAQGRTRRRLTRVLGDVGHDVVEVDDVAGVLAACRAAPADVVVLDARLCPPGEAGLPALKADPDAYRTAVVLMYGGSLATPEVLENLRRGVQDYLVEPVADGEVVARVEAAGRTKALQEALVEQARRLESLVREDPLTGLANRRFILTQLAGMLSGAKRHERPVSLAIVDIDHFKAVNDEHGHQAGDAVLVDVVRVMRAHLRAEDQLGRLGGEEFLVLLPDTGPASAIRVAEKLRTEVALAPARVPVTVSAGVASWDGEEAPEALMRRADEALYAAKDAGRDRVTAAPATLLRRT